MERKIGEIFEYNGEWYQVVEGYHCYDCDFRHENGSCIIDANYPESKIGNCNGDYRPDNQNIVFKKLEKVGEPFTGKAHIQLQRYNIYTKPIIDSAENVGYIDEGNTIAIEIKQNKEDMEEKKLIELLSEKVHNAWMKEKEAQGFSYGKEYDKEKKKHPDMLPYNELKEEVKEYDRATVKAVLQAQKELSADANKLSFKEFNLEAAKLGKPVCTRDGRKARVICFDSTLENYPLVVLVGDYPYSYTAEGKFNKDSESSSDLMMLPEKKEGWVNVYKKSIYKTKEEAFNRRDKENYLMTIKVDLEE